MAFKAFADFLNDVRSDGARLLGRIKDKNTFRRVVFSAYLVARADGAIDGAEKAALAKLIAKDLPQFSLDDIISTLNDADKKIDFDATIGEMELLSDIAKARGDEAQLIMRTAIYIGGSDGDFDNMEKKVARTLCVRMALKPNEFGL